ncbi:Arc family DNA-binding protein [Acetobacter ghanensis]|uniref:Arc family DNA-binding protein n=1 Tax=Acetobacter ghanensis TaxID=431306 RepID=UPI003D34F25E
MSRNDPQMKLRLPLEIKNEIERIAKNSGRSMNAEIVRRLEWVLNDGRTWYDVDGPDYPDRLKRENDPTASKYVRSSYPAEDFADDEVDLSPEQIEWLGLWRKMNEPQKHIVLAMVKAVVGPDAS